MTIKAQHPEYQEALEDWEQMRDSYKGERAVKAKGVQYLPPTSGMIADGMDRPEMPGAQRYSAYRIRAVFPDYVSDAVEAVIGIMHRKPPVISVPKQMEPLLKECTPGNAPLSLEQLLRQINEEQLVTGRLGILPDLPADPDPTNPLPYLATYQAETIINWDEDLVVLDESHMRRDKATFEWKAVAAYRVLQLMPVGGTDAEGTPVYHQHLFVQDGGQQPRYDETKMETPVLRGQPLEFLPFVFINSKDLLPKVDNPPLLGLSNLCMTIYRGEADYRQNLFLQGQDTLVIKGAMNDDEEQRTGAGSTLYVDSDGDAKYIGVSATGLPEQRTALENDRSAAAQKAIQLTDTTSRSKESGDALRVRVAAQTASMVHVALAGAGGLEKALRNIAEWMGLDAEKVTVEPNLDFADDKLLAKELVELMSAKGLGAPISKQTIHNIMRKRELTDLEFEEELALIEDEEPDLVGTGAPVNDPTLPPEDEVEEEDDTDGEGADDD